jgi:hypothetical protein
MERAVWLGAVTLPGSGDADPRWEGGGPAGLWPRKGVEALLLAGLPTEGEYSSLCDTSGAELSEAPDSDLRTFSPSPATTSAAATDAAQELGGSGGVPWPELNVIRLEGGVPYLRGSALTPGERALGDAPDSLVWPLSGRDMRRRGAKAGSAPSTVAFKPPAAALTCSSVLCCSVV